MRLRRAFLPTLLTLAPVIVLAQAPAAQPPAEETFQKALVALKAGGKLGWVEFRADWCGWCKKMEKFFGEGDTSAVLKKYYLMIPIDYEKAAGAPQLSARLGEKGNEGLPWFAVVDAGGKLLATSEGPKGNIGFPGNDVEAAHFLSVLRATAKGITPAELSLIEKALQAK